MEKKPSKFQLVFMLSVAVIAWTAVVLQFYIVTGTWKDLGLSPAEGTLRFFSYFTILTNILVALSLTVVLLKPQSKWGSFFNGNDMQTAISMYVFVVGIVYNIVLRSLWKPEGLQLIVDDLLHTVVPLLFVIYWLVFVPAEKMKWAKAVNWLLYPALYFIWVLFFGSITRFYPYPFIDVNVLGYLQMFIHAGILLIIFLLLGFAAIAVKTNIGKKAMPG
jgi:hypothetical protein